MLANEISLVYWWNNISVRGYLNLAFDRDIYEGVPNFQKCKELAQARNAESCIFINFEQGFTDIPILLDIEQYNFKSDEKHTYCQFVAFNLFEQNWRNGISLKSNGFFISKKSNIPIEAGDSLEFTTGNKEQK